MEDNKEAKEEILEEQKEEAKLSKKEKKAKAKEQLESLENELATLNDKYLRLTAEFDNYRKRTLKEKMELTKHGSEKVLINILPVLDNLERAEASTLRAENIEAVKEGVGLVIKNFKDFLKQQGIKEIEVIDKPFDMEVSEAITKIPAPKEEQKGTVIDCTEKGYLLHDKVIRYAKVVVGE